MENNNKKPADNTEFGDESNSNPNKDKKNK